MSTAGGSKPRWSRNGREIFFLADDQKIMVATYSATGDTFRADKPRVWSETTVTDFDLHPDGKRVAVLKAPESQSSSESGQLVFISNFFNELQRLAPASR